MVVVPDATHRAHLRNLPRSEWRVLIALMLAGAALRMLWQYDRPFTDDEGGTMLYIARDYRFLLTHFSDPWLSMNVYLCLVKFLSEATGGARWALVLPGFLASIAAIPLTASLVLRFASGGTALLAATLMTFDPYLVEYGMMIRSYSLFILAVLAMLTALYDWCAVPGWKHGLACGAWTFFALLMHLNTTYYLLFVAMILLLLLWRERTQPFAHLARVAATLSVPILVAVVAAAGAYAPMLEPLRDYKLRWSYSPPTPIDYLPHVATRYFGAGFFVIPSLVLLAVGLWYGSQRNHPLFVLGAAVVIPAAAASFLGSAYYPWVYARYFIPSLPLLLILVAAGIEHLSAGRPRVRGALVALLLASWLPSLGEGFREKKEYPWIELQSQVRGQLKPDDLILAMDSELISTGADLLPYFPLERFASLAGYARATNLEPSGLIVITPSRPLVTRAPHGSAGKIQWVVYRGSRPAIARALFNDLLRTVGDDVSPRLAMHYHVLLALAGQLGVPDPDGTLTARYYRSNAATLRQRFLPPQLHHTPLD